MVLEQFHFNINLTETRPLYGFFPNTISNSCKNLYPLQK